MKQYLDFLQMVRNKGSKKLTELEQGLRVSLATKCALTSMMASLW